MTLIPSCREIAGVLLFHEIHQLPSSESRSPEGECHLLKCWNMLVQKYGVISQHNYSFENLNIEFAVTFYGFQLYFMMVETETADTVTESYT
jgi:hypothetical protein